MSLIESARLTKEEAERFYDPGGWGSGDDQDWPRWDADGLQAIQLAKFGWTMVDWLAQWDMREFTGAQVRLSLISHLEAASIERPQREP